MDISSEEIFGEEGSPLNRTNFAVGVYQNVIYIYGGECSFTGRGLGDFWQYRPDINKWCLLCLKPSPGRLRGARFVAVGDGLLLFGGEISENSDQCPLWHYSPFSSTGDFEKVKCFGSFPQNKLQTSLIWHNKTDGNHIYLFGGFHHLIGPSDEFWSYKISSSKWTRLKEGPSPRYNAAIAIYQSTILIAGGLTGAASGDIWGYHTEINQWLQWTKTLPRQIGGSSFIKNEVLYTFSEDQNNSETAFLHGFDLVDRKSQTFRHEIPNASGFGLVSLGNRSQSRRVRSASHIDKISRRGQVRPSIGYINSGYQHGEKTIFDFNSVRKDINENYGVSLTEVRNQLHDLSAVHYDAKLKKINFPKNSKSSSFTPQMLFSETSSFSTSSDSDCQNSDFDRGKSKSCRTSVQQEKREKTPVQQYDPFNMEPFLLILGGKSRKPVFKRHPMKTWKVYL